MNACMDRYNCMADGLQGTSVSVLGNELFKQLHKKQQKHAMRAMRASLVPLKVLMQALVL